LHKTLLLIFFKFASFKISHNFRKRGFWLYFHPSKFHPIPSTGTQKKVVIRARERAGSFKLATEYRLALSDAQRGQQHPATRLTQSITTYVSLEKRDENLSLCWVLVDRLTKWANKLSKETSKNNWLVGKTFSGVVGVLLARATEIYGWNKTRLAPSVLPLACAFDFWSIILCLDLERVRHLCSFHVWEED
jgi:hypothetical protein